LVAVAGLVVSIGLMSNEPRLSAQTPLPARLATYLDKYTKLTPAERARLATGQPVTALLDADPSTEVAVFGAVWIGAPVAAYLATVRDIERLESGGSFRITRKVSSPPRLEDFAELTLPADDAADLRHCRVGQCQLKLSEAAIGRLRREIRWDAGTARADLDQLARRLALEYVTGYLEGGNARLAAYRDGARPLFVAREFQSMIDRLPSLDEFLPDVRRYLLEFPNATLPGSESFVYWQEAQFGLKPTIRINHLVTIPRPEGAVVASKMLYASHYFWTALELRLLLEDSARGKGFWFVSINRSRSDGLSGFVGRLIRGKVRGEALSGMTAVLTATKTALERGR
jgi:hypothetical protein